MELKAEEVGADGRYQLAAARAPKKRPRWWRDAVLRYARADVSHEDVAAALGKSARQVGKVLRSPWAKDVLRDIEARARATMVERGVDPILQMQIAAPEMAGIMLDAARVETKPYQRAMIAKENLALAGHVAVNKSMNLNVNMDMKDLPDGALEEWARTGVPPEHLRGKYLPSPTEPAE